MSGNTSRKRGRSRELQWRDELRNRGSWAERVDCAADVVEMRRGERPMFWQVKSTVTPYSHFGPEDRAKLRDEARLAGAACALCWCPKGVGISRAEEIDEANWP